MQNNIKELIKLGPIPNDCEMSNELFERYDNLLKFEYALSYEEAEQIIAFFSPDCDDLNWALLHAIESVPFQNQTERYKALIDKCNNAEYKEILYKRLYNFLAR